MKKLTVEERWKQGIGHDSRSISLANAISKVDSEIGNNRLDLKFGGDGDNGEHLLFILDDYFSSQDEASANNCSDDSEDIFGYDVSQAMCQAFLDYKDKLAEIYKNFPDEKLAQFADKITREEIISASKSRILIEKSTAATELFYRNIFRKSQIAFDAGAQSYCVYHDCDSAKCVKEHSE